MLMEELIIIITIMLIIITIIITIMLIIVTIVIKQKLKNIKYHDN